MNHPVALVKSFLFSVLLALSISVTAQKQIQLYPGAAPGSESWTWNEKETYNDMLKAKIIYNVSHPTLTVYLPTVASNGTTVLVFPGGSYHVLIMNPAVPDLVKELNQKGITVFVLKYRLVKSLTDDPFQEMMAKMSDPEKFEKDITPVVAMSEEDTKTAIIYIRQNAGEYQVDAKRVGVLGFSAGGGLAVSLAYHFTPETRPDFVAPIYALMEGIQSGNVPPDAPPLFLAAATDDQIVPVSGSVHLYSEWSASKHVAEMHIYAKGNHGLISFPANAWMSRFEEWLDQQGLITPKK